MSRVFEIVRILCGILVVVSGLMNLGLFGFEPPGAEPGGRQFQLAMQEAGYFLPIITAVFFAAGTSIIIDRFGALGSLLLAPISANILLFHAVLGGGHIALAIVFFAINLYCIWYYRNAYTALFKPRI